MGAYLTESNSSGNFSSRDTENGSVLLPPTLVGIFSVLMVTLVIVIVSGNALVILAFIVDKSLRTQSNYFFLNLAISDFLVGESPSSASTSPLLLLCSWPLFDVPVSSGASSLWSQGLFEWPTPISGLCHNYIYNATVYIYSYQWTIETTSWNMDAIYEQRSTCSFDTVVWLLKVQRLEMWCWASVLRLTVRPLAAQVPSASRSTFLTTWQVAGCWAEVSARCGCSWTTCSARRPSSTSSSSVTTAFSPSPERWGASTRTTHQRAHFHTPAHWHNDFRALLWVTACAMVAVSIVLSRGGSGLSCVLVMYFCQL